MKKLIFLLIGSLVFFVSGCSQEEPASVASKVVRKKPVQAVDVKPRIFLQDSITLNSLERVGEALSVWRQFSEQKPTLLILSNYPLLMPVPTQLRDQVSETVVDASSDVLSSLCNIDLPAPLFLPEMTVDIALREGWFGRLAWAIPLRDPGQELSLQSLTEKLEKYQFANEQELATLSLEDDLFYATLREIPATIAALPNLPEIEGPVIIHLDQGYFQEMYKNEIATPMLQVVTNTLKALRDRKIPVLAVTFDNSNLVGRISLDVRFMQHVLARMIESPELLDQKMPINWQRKADILYLSNFFKKDETRELALAMDADEPDAAWIKFDLYRSAVEHNKGKDALGFLAEAVKLDKVYAMEYLALADMAFEKGRPDEAMRMLSLAAAVFPENVQIKLKVAHLANGLNQKDTALHLVEQLQKLEWSNAYYPDMRQYLDDFAAYLRGEEATGPNNYAKDPRRQRILK